MSRLLIFFTFFTFCFLFIQKGLDFILICSYLVSFSYKNLKKNKICAQFNNGVR